MKKAEDRKKSTSRESVALMERQRRGGEKEHLNE